MATLEERLKTHSLCFSSMVELIPAKFYLTKDPETQEHVQTSKFWVNKKSKAPKQSVKEATKRAKRMKLDPGNQKTIQDQQREADQIVKDQNDFGGLETSKGDNSFSVETVRSTELGDLRERLREKIDSLRGKRIITEQDSEQIAVLKKQKRIEKKNRKKDFRQKKKRKAEIESTKTIEKDRPSIKDEHGKIVFSKFDFSIPKLTGEGTQRKKDYRKLLAKAEATEKKLEELKRNDEKRGEELQEKLQWRRAMDLAKGTKVKDDTKLLKKTLKRLDQKKSKSLKLWADRLDHEQQQKDKKQEARKKHIQERIDQIKAKKNKKKFKKGKRTPGF